MNRGGIGVGSASIVLVFAVLCLTIFSLISFMVTQNTKALIVAEAQLVVGYYNTETQSAIILAQLLNAETIPPSINGIEINIEDSQEAHTKVVNFSYPIYDVASKVLFVRVAITGDSYELLSWRLVNTEEWEPEGAFNVLR